jgi:hypothetical protein
MYEKSTISLITKYGAHSEEDKLTEEFLQSLLQKSKLLFASELEANRTVIEKIKAKHKNIEDSLLLSYSGSLHITIIKNLCDKLDIQYRQAFKRDMKEKFDMAISSLPIHSTDLVSVDI